MGKIWLSSASTHRFKNNSPIRIGVLMASTKSAMNRGVMFIVSLLVVGLLTVYLGPIFLDEYAEVDDEGWGSAEAALWGLIGIFFVIAIVIYFVRLAVDA